MYPWIIVVCAIFFSGCMVGPNFKDPALRVETHWSGETKTINERPFKQVTWWRVFHDPTLTALIEAGYKNNLSLQMAGARVLRARAQLAQTVGQLYPQQQEFTGNYTFNRTGGGTFESILPSSFSIASLGFSANWEIDFWGKYRRAIQSNDANFLASLKAYDQALVTLTADIASVYIQYRTTQALIKITRLNIQLQATSLKIAQSRFNAGETSLLDVEQAKTELAQTQSSLPGLISNLQQQKDALAVLLGITPHQVDPLITTSYGIPKTPQQIAVGIPKESLLMRPDIHQARLDAIAQSESIGASKAMLYPSLSLSGNFAYSANTIGGQSLSSIFDPSNQVIVAGPVINWPLLNYGQLTNAVRVQDAAFQEALLRYENLVLQAQQEIQDSITGFIESKKTAHYLHQANRSAMKSTELSLIRYKEGEIDFTPVLNAEQQQLSVQTSYINAQGQVPNELVALYRALGGGWQIRNSDDILPKEIKDAMAKRTNWGDLLEQPNHQPPKTETEAIKQLVLPAW